MKVKHDANELNEGETMILTLADRNILDDTGSLVEDPEELENVLVVSCVTTVTKLTYAWRQKKIAYLCIWKAHFLGWNSLCSMGKISVQTP